MLVYYPKQDRTIVFIHNPKVAGTAIGSAINLNHERAKYRRHIPWWRLCDGDKELPSFGFVRNPWDRMWSMYRWFIPRMHKFDCFAEFEEWLSWETLPWADRTRSQLKHRPWLPDFHKLPQTWWLDGVDYVGRYERLEEDLVSIAGKLKVPLKPLQWENRSVERGGYREAYSEGMKEIVAERFATDVAKWGYEF